MSQAPLFLLLLLAAHVTAASTQPPAPSDNPSFPLHNNKTEMLTAFLLLQVGGLPLPELNHLELQFLLLNDFRLAVPVEDLEAYATMLVEFYAREVVAQRSGSGGGD